MKSQTFKKKKNPNQVAVHKLAKGPESTITN